MPAIRLLLADVDGTLLTPEKVLTPRACQAVRRLRERGIAFAIISGRPPRGLRMLVEPLGIDTPMTTFNGGMLVRPDLTPIERKLLPADTIAETHEALARHRLDAWVYLSRDDGGVSWLVPALDRPHVEHEQRTVQFAPEVAPELAALRDGVVKIVGVGDDVEAVARCEEELRTGCRISAARSQPYYLDVTHPDANKGTAARRLSALLSIPCEHIASIGDMPTDIGMFQASGLSIAMGNAGPEVQRVASELTASNEDEGFARAVERLLLG